MNVVLDNDTNKVTLECNNIEFRTIKHLYKVYGNNFLKNYLEKFVNQRREQRMAKRAQDVGNRFNDLDGATQNQVLGILGITLDDE